MQLHIFSCMKKHKQSGTAAPLLDEVHPVKANINVRDNKTTNNFFITCSPSVSWVFCFCCYMYHIGGRLKKD